MDSIKLDHTSIKCDFLQHLKIFGNHRILFTAPFGSGKSTFLNEVFQDEQAKYFTLKLFPVNYSLSPNEDIFELIKFDLIIQLIGLYKDEVCLKKEDFTTLLSSQVYISERLKVMPIVNALLGLSGKVGKSAVELIKAFSDTIKHFEEFKEEIKIDEEKQLQNFLAQIEKRKGSIYEMDEISALIYDLIERVKENKPAADEVIDSVLIIDDLDRLDPEHTFRLFNVFAAHFDDLNYGNKFGFDKVIFVCDMENIWKQYRHKYGFDVDFKGYLDKFYSYHPFDFDNRKYVKQKIGEFLRAINTTNTNNGRLFTHLTNSDHEFDFYYIIRWLLLSLVNSKSLNIRTLVSSRAYHFPDYNFDTHKDRRQSGDYEILLLFRLLKEFYSSYDIVKEKLILLNILFTDESIQKSSEHENINNDFISKKIKSTFLPFLLPKDLGLKRLFDKEDARVAYSGTLKVWLHYEIDNSSSSSFDRLVFLKATEDNDPSSTEIKVSSYQMLNTCFDECLKLGALS